MGFKGGVMEVFLARFMRCNQSQFHKQGFRDLFAKCFIARLFVSKLFILGLFVYGMFHIAHAETQSTQIFVPQKPLTAIQGSFLAWYQQCAKRNYASCGLVGRAYYEGYGVLPNMARAKRYFTKACYNGVVESCLLLSNFTKENAKQEYMVLLYQQACDLDHKESCLKLSDILLKEVINDITDSKKAEISHTLDKICKLENDKECFRKKAFEAQFDSNANALLAVEFQRDFAACKKAKQEHADDMRVCGEVGIKYARGLGVAKDKEEAQTYFHIACKKHSEFCRYEILDSILN